MSNTINVDVFDSASMKRAILKLQRHRSSQASALKQTCMDLASLGATRASLDYARTPYDGNKDVTISVEDIPNGAKIVASGESVLFLEYGAGAKYGYGHPEPGAYGPGTFNPNSDNWQDPNGWYYAHGQKSWGNPPSAAMYNAKQVIKDRAATINGVSIHD